MLSLRLVTIAILLPLTVWLIISVSQPVFITLSTIVILYAASEWATLMGFTKLFSRGLFLLLLVLTFMASAAVKVPVLYGTAFFWWGLAFVWILIFPAGVPVWNRTFILVILGIEVLMPCWLSLIKIREEFGAYFLLYLFTLIWAADTGAYIVGKLYGKHKLIPKVSPGKTIEGLLGGMSLVIIVAAVASYYAQLQTFQEWLLWFVLAVATGLFSIVGDLLISILKRNRGLKDSGRLLPGHGGLLDRIDSLLSAAPLFYVGILWMSQHYHLWAKSI